jgi:hypothetical protein
VRLYLIGHSIDNRINADVIESMMEVFGEEAEEEGEDEGEGEIDADGNCEYHQA